MMWKRWWRETSTFLRRIKKLCQKKQTLVFFIQLQPIRRHVPAVLFFLFEFLIYYYLKSLRREARKLVSLYVFTGFLILYSCLFSLRRSFCFYFMKNFLFAVNSQQSHWSHCKYRIWSRVIHLMSRSQTAVHHGKMCYTASARVKMNSRDKSDVFMQLFDGSWQTRFLCSSCFIFAVAHSASSRLWLAGRSQTGSNTERKSLSHTQHSKQQRKS